MPSEKSSTSKLIFEKARAGYAAVYLVSAEDMRSQREIKRAAKDLGRKLYVWTFGKGLVEDGKNSTVLPETEFPPQVLKLLGGEEEQGRKKTVEEKSIIVLRLFHHFMDDPLVQSKLLDIIPEYKTSQRMLVVLAPVIKLPPELEKEFSLIETQLPSKEELLEVLDGIISTSGLKGDLIPADERKNELTEAALGLTTNEAENALSLSIIRPRIAKSHAIWDPRIVMSEKCLALKKTGLLEYIPAPEGGLGDVGGLQYLKEWLSKRKTAFTPRAREFGLPPPKGIILVGPAGCGKSLTAKAASAVFNAPLLRLDMGKMFGSLVGQSEANIRSAIQVAEAISPCILWVDEIEKGVAGANAGSLDSGVGARVLGTILTWMQEKKSSVFVFATANDVTGLPPELLRKGRFDEMFSVDLPNEKERKEILEIHLKKRNRGHLINKGINVNHFAGETTAGFSGAEIEAGIVDALYSAFDMNRDLTDLDLQTAFDSTNPLSKTMSEKITSIRSWCSTRTRPANAPNVTNAPMNLDGRMVMA